MRAAGAIVVGKTNVPEFGAGANSRNVVWGATGNPFNPMLNAGGSSGGSAVALACDMLPVCTGSDTGGSLRIPGAINGVVGFRPSPGLVAVERRGLGWTPISVVGPLGRTVADACLLLAAQAAMDDCDPLSYPIDPKSFAVPEACDLGNLRVAYTEDFGICPVDKPIRKVFRDKLAAMKHLFKSCDEVTFDLKDADRCFDVIRAANYVAKYRDAYEKDPNTLGPNVRANYEIGAKMTLADMCWAHLEEDAHVPPLSTDVPGLRPRARADHAGIAVPVVAALPGGNGRQAAEQLLPLAVVDLRSHARDQSRDRTAVRLRSSGHAIRAAGRRPLSRGSRPARCVARHGTGVQFHSCVEASETRFGQTHRADTRAEVDRDAPAIGVINENVNAQDSLRRSRNATQALAALALVTGLAENAMATPAVDDILTTAWEIFWRQSGYPMPISKWRGPIRVSVTGVSVQRQKDFAVQQLKLVADEAGIDVSESDSSEANLQVEIVSSNAARPYNESCTTSFSSKDGLIGRAKVHTNEQSVYRCMLHESMHVMGLSGHPMANSVLTYFARPAQLTDIDKFLLKTIYSDAVAPGISPFAALSILARTIENEAGATEKDAVRRATAAFSVRTFKDMESFAAGNGDPPSAVLRSSKGTSAGIARGQVEMQFFLGLAYLNGQFVEVDKSKAIFWLSKASEASHTDARKLLETLRGESK